MSEMLGNQYFMARNYGEAQKYLLPAYERDSSNKLVKRKLVICFFMTGNVQKAFDFFFELISEDIEYITKADPISDDCPCHEIIRELNLENLPEAHQFEQLVLRGIIWLFCNPKQSLTFFEKAYKLEPQNVKVSQTLNIIQQYIKTEKESV
jgi:tetratricopeptide (TPR) repeat protein